MDNLLHALGLGAAIFTAWAVGGLVFLLLIRAGRRR